MPREKELEDQGEGAENPGGMWEEGAPAGETRDPGKIGVGGPEAAPGNSRVGSCTSGAAIRWRVQNRLGAGR